MLGKRKRLPRRAWLLLAAECSALLAVLALGWRLPQPLSLSGAEISSYSDKTVVDAGGARLSEALVETMDFATTPWLMMDGGSYTVLVSYTAEGHGGSVRFINEEVQANTVLLQPIATSARFTARLPAHLDDAQLRFAVLGAGTNGEEASPSNLTVHGVQLIPTHAALRVRLVQLAAFFAVLNLALALYSGLWNPFASRRAALTALALGTIALFASLPLGFDGVLYGEQIGHDLGFHLTRIQGLADGLAAGQFPVRIAPTVLHGNGYASDVFYCPLFLYPFALLRLWGFSLQGCFQAYTVCVNLFTSVVAWRCARAMTGSNRAGLLASGLYTLGLYRLGNLYTRAALGEFTAMAFLPLVVYGFWRILAAPHGGRGPSWLPLALGYTGVVSCHVLSTEMTLVFSAAAVLLCWRRALSPRALAAFATAALTTAVLTAWYWLPFLDYLLNQRFSVNSHAEVEPYLVVRTAAYLSQIFSAFVNGGGLSTPLSMTLSEEMGLSVGLAPLVGAGLWAVCMGIKELRQKPLYRTGLLGLGLGLLAVWAASDLFPWFWLARHSSLVLTMLDSIQYLWRFLGFASLFLALAAAAAFQLLEAQGGAERRLAKAAAGLMAALTLVSSSWLFYAAGQASRPTRFYDLADLSTGTLQIGSGEYLPAECWRTAAWAFHEPGGEALVRAERTPQALTLQLVNETGRDSFVDTTLLSYRYYTAADTATGQALTLTTNENGFVRVAVPPGYRGSVSITWKAPLLWRLAECVSLAAWLGLGAWLWRRGKRAKAQPPRS